MEIKNRQELIFNNINNLQNKDSLDRNQFSYLFNKMLRMFKYSNLPKTIPEKDLEIILQTQGYVTFAIDIDSINKVIEDTEGEPDGSKE